jgi:hypothetical protein
MRSLLHAALLAALLLPSLALADKHFMSDHGGTWDCASDPMVNIMTNDATYVLKGACKKIDVNGNHDTIHVEAAERVVINGNDNTVDAGKLVSLAINGNTNTFKAKSHVEQVSNSGKDNKIDAGK